MSAELQQSAGRVDESKLALLWRAAQAGNIDAQARLAWQLLGYPPYNVRAGLAMANLATQAGHPEAPYILSLHAATGVGLPHSWRGAIGYLQLSAERGYRRAQAELAALAGKWDLAAELAAVGAQAANITPPQWKQLSDAIEIVAWLAVPEPQVISASPRLAAVERFASQEICDWLIERARPRMVRAPTVDAGTGDAVYSQARTNSHCHFPMAETDLVLHLLRARIARVTGVPTGALDHTTILHYSVGEQFFPHFDYFDPASPGYEDELRAQGQRILTLLVYLNAGFEGGETDFPTAGLRYKGDRGDALFFWNVERGGAPDPRTLHAGLPPTTGEKWLLSQWIRDRSLIPDRF